MLGHRPGHQANRCRPQGCCPQGVGNKDQREGVVGIGHRVQNRPAFETQRCCRVLPEGERVERHPENCLPRQCHSEVEQERDVREDDAPPDHSGLGGFDLRATITTLAVVVGVGVLVIDVVDAIDQKIERERHPDQDWKNLPRPEIAREPHTNDGRADRVHPQHGARNLDEPPNHVPSLSGAPASLAQESLGRSGPRWSLYCMAWATGFIWIRSKFTCPGSDSA